MFWNKVIAETQLSGKNFTLKFILKGSLYMIIGIKVGNSNILLNPYAAISSVNQYIFNIYFSQKKNKVRPN